MKARDIFDGNNGDATKAYYLDLNARGPAGELAVALFRAQKRSTAAKRYRRGKFRHAAYDVKNWSLTEICRVLVAHGAALCVTWGWGRDEGTPGYEWVLYVDLPNGQMSFHSAERFAGPDYPGQWDRQHLSEERIIAFCDWVEEGQPAHAWVLPSLLREPVTVHAPSKEELAKVPCPHQQGGLF